MNIRYGVVTKQVLEEWDKKKYRNLANMRASGDFSITSELLKDANGQAILDDNGMEQYDVSISGPELANDPKFKDLWDGVGRRIVATVHAGKTYDGKQSPEYMIDGVSSGIDIGELSNFIDERRKVDKDGTSVVKHGLACDCCGVWRDRSAAVVFAPCDENEQIIRNADGTIDFKFAGSSCLKNKLHFENNILFFEDALRKVERSVTSESEPVDRKRIDLSNLKANGTSRGRLMAFEDIVNRAFDVDASGVARFSDKVDMPDGGIDSKKKLKAVAEKISTYKVAQRYAVEALGQRGYVGSGNIAEWTLILSKSRISDVFQSAEDANFNKFEELFDIKSAVDARSHFDDLLRKYKDDVESGRVVISDAVDKNAMTLADMAAKGEDAAFKADAVEPIIAAMDRLMRRYDNAALISDYQTRYNGKFNDIEIYKDGEKLDDVLYADAIDHHGLGSSRNRRNQLYFAENRYGVRPETTITISSSNGDRSFRLPSYTVDTHVAGGQIVDPETHEPLSDVYYMDSKTKEFVFNSSKLKEPLRMSINDIAKYLGDGFNEDIISRFAKGESIVCRNRPIDIEMVQKHMSREETNKGEFNDGYDAVLYRQKTKTGAYMYFGIGMDPDSGRMCEYLISKYSDIDKICDFVEPTGKKVHMYEYGRDGMWDGSREQVVVHFKSNKNVSFAYDYGYDDKRDKRKFVSMPTGEFVGKLCRDANSLELWNDSVAKAYGKIAMYCEPAQGNENMRDYIAIGQEKDGSLCKLVVSARQIANARSKNDSEKFQQTAGVKQKSADRCISPTGMLYTVAGDVGKSQQLEKVYVDLDDAACVTVQSQYNSNDDRNYEYKQMPVDKFKSMLFKSADPAKSWSEWKTNDDKSEYSVNPSIRKAVEKAIEFCKSNNDTQILGKTVTEQLRCSYSEIIGKDSGDFLESDRARLNKIYSLMKDCCDVNQNTSISEEEIERLNKTYGNALYDMVDDLSAEDVEKMFDFSK